MKITQITERAKQVKAKDKMPKVSKPTHGHESPHPMQGKMVGEVKHKMSKQPNPVAKHSRNKSGAGAHKSAKDYEKKIKLDLIKYSAGGLRDFSRIAASNEIMWRDIFFDNSYNLSLIHI